ncbi:regulatory protein RecX [Cohnella zeiphila]|uniref:Regulatory protein RecX n=1 Tax=Cohnella zeiphila TaxID=2761120 RepID=A0A7X0SSV9_9BACL|nr:RecX family transcriptional regulator [Cohnella zeiphila]MBB6735499.1 RecX family transcriptional regulator [Cohnella zeiphila]
MEKEEHDGLAFVPGAAVVTAVEPDPRRKGMYRVSVLAPGGGEPVLLSVHEDTLVGWRLLKGRSLSGDEWSGLRKSEETEQAYRSALAMLDRKARTRKELERALKRKEHSAEAIAACLDRLIAHRLLDDAAFAQRFAEQKVSAQSKGRRLVRQELLQRGVAKSDVEQAISSLDGEAERESALALARKRWPSVKGASRRERLYKLAAMLQRRGFPGGLAMEAARRAADDEAEQAEETEWSETEEGWDT